MILICVCVKEGMQPPTASLYPFFQHRNVFQSVRELLLQSTKEFLVALDQSTARQLNQNISPHFLSPDPGLWPQVDV